MNIRLPRFASSASKPKNSLSTILHPNQSFLFFLASDRRVISQLADPSPRVRYAALNCVGQFSSDLAPVLQLESSDIVLPALIRVIASEARWWVRMRGNRSCNNSEHFNHFAFLVSSEKSKRPNSGRLPEIFSPCFARKKSENSGLNHPIFTPHIFDLISSYLTTGSAAAECACARARHVGSVELQRWLRGRGTATARRSTDRGFRYALFG